MGFGKAVGGCYACIKYLLFGFNFLFWLIGVAIMAVGIWVRVDPSFSQALAGSGSLGYLYIGAYFMIAVGAIIMIVGFVGCCGAIRESQCLLVTFFIFLIIISIVLVGIGVLAYKYKETAEELTKDVAAQTIQDAVDKYYDDESSRKMMDAIQEQHNCCGAKNGMSDYGLKGPPTSCQSIFHSEPCANKDVFGSPFSQKLTVITGVAIGIAILLLAGMVLSMVLCCAIRETLVL